MAHLGVREKSRIHQTPLQKILQSGGSMWLFRTKTAAIGNYPGDGYMLWDDLTQVSATHLVFSHATADNLDLDVILPTLASGDTLYVQDSANADNYQQWTVSGSAVNSTTGGSYWTVPVTFVGSGGTGTTNFPNNVQLSVFVKSSSGGGGGTVTSVDITSTAGTIVPTGGPITTAGNINVEITGLPPADDTNALGSHTRRWTILWLPLDGAVAFDTGTPGQTNVATYVDGVGPNWFDRTTSQNLTFNLQSIGASRTATWQNSSGTVAWLTDIPVAGITALTGDGTATGPGSVALTLATVNSNVGTFGSATQVGQFTVNGKGLITAASSVAITAPTLQTARTIAMSGDVVWSVSFDGSGNVTAAGTIQPDAVTNAKLADMAAHTLKANITGSSANPVDSSLSAILDAEIGSTQGSIVYRNASAWAPLTPGTSGQVLQSGGAAANPSWGAITGGGVPAGTFGQQIYYSGANTVEAFSQRTLRYGWMDSDDFVQRPYNVGTNTFGGDTFGGKSVYSIVLGAGGGPAFQTFEKGHPGIVQMNAGTTNNSGRVILYSANGLPMLDEGGGSDLVFYIKTDATLSNGTNRYQLAGGWNDAIFAGGAANRASWFYSDNVSSGVFTIQVTVASVAQTAAVGTTTVLASTWYRLRLNINAAYTVITLYISVGTVSGGVTTWGAEYQDCQYTGTMPVSSNGYYLSTYINRPTGSANSNYLVDGWEAAIYLAAARGG